MYYNQSTWLDRFCAKHPRFGIPNLMLYIVIGNVVVYLLDLFSRGTFSSLLAFVPAYIFQGQVWRVLTFILIPMDSSNLFFLALTCYFYYWIGSLLEREWGAVKFTVYYMMGVLFNVVFGLIAGIFAPYSYISIYYVNMSLFFAFATLYPDMQVLLFFIIPIKVKWMAWVDAAYFALMSLSALLVDHSVVGFLVPIVAVLNYVIMFWPEISYRIGRAKRKADPTVINFKRAQKQAQKKAQETGGYTHKCAVCGITDQDDPNMEFRYCSKCDGYYCYCMNHINNHVHIHDN